MSGIEVWVRGSDRRTLGPLLTSWRSCTIVQRRNDVGTWLLEFPVTADLTMFEPGTGVIIRRDGVTWVSGWMWGPRERKELGIERTGLVGGWDDTVILDDALCWPQPSLPIGDQTDSPFTTAQNVPAAGRVAQLFEANVVDRQQIPGAAVESSGSLGQPGRSLLVFDNLLDHAQEICGADVNFWVRQRDSDQALALQFRAPRDLRQSVRFSPQVGTVQGWNATDAGPEVQEVILGAGDDGASRVFRRRTATQAGLVGSRVEDWGGVRKIERFLDERGLDPADPLFVDDANERMDAELRDGRRRQSLQVEVSGTLPFRQPVTQGGFDVGDLGVAYVDPAGTDSVEDLIEQVEWSMTPDTGERMQVWVGPVNDPDEWDADREKRLRKQVDRLMRSLP